MARYQPSHRSPSGNARQTLSAAVALAIAVIVIACHSYNPPAASSRSGRRSSTPSIGAPSAPASLASNLLLGNPSNAGTDVNNYLLTKPYFVISYNAEKGGPNWVSWRVTRDDLGDAPRRDTFEPDESLPPGIQQIVTKDYTGSGFDRGHLCPHGDRTKNLEMSYATFIMTNIVPQAHNLNEKAWDSLEMYCRDLARNEHDRIYIIAGPAGSGGTGLFGRKETIAGGRVIVPAVCWKVIVAVPDDGTEDLADVTASSRVIAVIMPNDQNVGFEWDQYRVSPAEVEKLTGYHFFTALPPNIAAALRVKVDRVLIPTPEETKHYNNEGKPAKRSGGNNWN